MKNKIPNSAIIPQYGNALSNGSAHAIVDLSKSVRFDFNFQLQGIADMITEFNGEMPPNRIPHYIIAIITEGSGIKNIGSYSFEIEPGLAMVFPKNVIHSSQNWSLSTKGFMLTFDESLFSEFHFPLSFVDLPKLFKYSIKPYQKVEKSDLDSIVSCFLELDKLKDNLTGANCKLFILKLTELISIYEKIIIEEQSRDNCNGVHIDRFLELLELNFSKHHNVRFYADKLGKHPNYLNSLVKSQFNLTVRDYIHQRVFLEAKYLLSTTQLTIKEVAFEIGFNDSNYFCRQFKKAFGVSPGVYKKQNS